MSMACYELYTRKGLQGEKQRLMKHWGPETEKESLFSIGKDSFISLKKFPVCFSSSGAYPCIGIKTREVLYNDRN